MSFSNRRSACRRGLSRTVASVAAVSLFAVTGCMASPSDTPTVEGNDKAAPEQPAKPGETDAERQITVGVDEFTDGFNPHLLADVSPVTDLVAALTLPSAFVPSSADMTKLELNRDLLESVRTFGGDGSPTAIRYVLKQGAQWSDGTPISGEDFRYLYDKLTNSPGAADSVAYSSISDVEVSAGGRQIDVTFSTPMAQWQRLFRNLLPSHLLRASTDSFSSLLKTVIPASGARYTVQSLDVGRNFIRLVRNDRFWGESPAVTEAVTIRAVRDSVAGADQLRSRQLQAVQVRPTETAALTYGLVPQTVESEHTVPRTLLVTANLASPRLADVAARRQIFNHLNSAQLSAVATGRSDSAESELSAPQRSVSEANSEDRDPLHIGVIGSGRQVVAAASAVADQLTAAGVPAVVDTAGSVDLTRSLLPYGNVDLVVNWSDSVETMADARARYLCPSSAIGSLAPESSSGAGKASETTSSSTQSGEPSESSSASTVKSVEPEKVIPDSESSSFANQKKSSEKRGRTGLVAQHTTARTSNLSGLCNPDIDALLSGDTAEVPAQLAEMINQQALELPIVDDKVLTVLSPGVAMPGHTNVKEWPSGPYIGKLMSVPNWQRVLTKEEKAQAAKDKGSTRNDSEGK